MITGQQIVNGWKQNSLTYFQYVELCKKIGKDKAVFKYTPLTEYIDRAYLRYRQLMYHLGITPLTLGKWLRSEI